MALLVYYSYATGSRQFLAFLPAPNVLLAAFHGRQICVTYPAPIPFISAPTDAMKPRYHWFRGTLKPKWVSPGAECVLKGAQRGGEQLNQVHTPQSRLYTDTWDEFHRTLAPDLPGRARWNMNRSRQIYIHNR